MVSSETPTAALLAPWLDYARDAMDGSLGELADPSDLDEDLWISWCLGERADGVDEWIFTLEAIELLDLYVRVDYRAAWAWILDALGMPAYVSLLDDLPVCIYPKHTISWAQLGQGERDGGDDEASRLQRAEQLVFAIPEHLHSPQFQNVWTAMMMRWKRQQRDPAERVRVCVYVVLEELDENDEGGAARALKELDGLAAYVEDPSRRELREQLERVSLTASATAPAPDPDPRVAPRPTELFRLERVEITTGDSLLTDPMLASIRAIHHRGVHVSSLTIDRGVRVRDVVSLTATTDFMRSLVVPATAPSVAMVSIDSDMEIGLFQAFCSALSVTQSITDARVAAPNVPRDQYWSWIAYALLSGDTPNAIEWVRLAVQQLTMQDAEQIERVLCARDPLAALAPLSWSSVAQDAFARERDVVDVRPTTTGLVRTDSTSSTEVAPLIPVTVDERSCTDLRVVNDALSRTHVCVLYPGAGLCWVRRDAIVARRHLPPREHHTSLHLHRIEFELGHETSLPALLALVRLLGPHTKILMLFASNRTELPDAFMCEVLSACPQLERLELTYVTLASFAWLTDTGARSLQSLRLKHVESLDPQGYAPLFAALRDSEERGPGHALRELAVRDYIEELAPAWPALLAMVTTNRRLERLLVRMRVDDEDHDNELQETLARQLDAYHGAPLPGKAARPFPVLSRLALRSVFAHRPAWRPLDEPLLAIVWALAAPIKRRVCGVVRRAVVSGAATH